MAVKLAFWFQLPKTNGPVPTGLVVPLGFFSMLGAAMKATWPPMPPAR